MVRLKEEEGGGDEDVSGYGDRWGTSRAAHTERTWADRGRERGPSTAWRPTGDDDEEDSICRHRERERPKDPEGEEDLREGESTSMGKRRMQGREEFKLEEEDDEEGDRQRYMWSRWLFNRDAET